MDKNELAKRVEELEIKLLHVEHDVVTLNNLIVDQSETIRLLQDGYKLLLRRLEAVEPTDGTLSSTELPPHY